MLFLRGRQCWDDLVWGGRVLTIPFFENCLHSGANCPLLCDSGLYGGLNSPLFSDSGLYGRFYVLGGGRLAEGAAEVGHRKDDNEDQGGYPHGFSSLFLRFRPGACWESHGNVLDVEFFGRLFAHAG